MPGARRTARRLISEAAERGELTGTVKGDLLVLVAALPPKGAEPELLEDLREPDFLDALLAQLRSNQLQREERGHPATLPDDSAIFAARLFAPFALDETDFPLHCSATVLSSMLSEPPAASVPVPQSQLSQCNAKWTDRQHPLFVQERDTSAPALVPMLHTAVCHALPRGRPSELLMTPFWNAIGMAFPEQIGQLLGLDIVIDRNVEEMTITERLLKRDYMCKLEYRPCIVGEDKSNPNQQQEAVQDAVDKYRTVNAVTYGRLGYILMVTMAGSWMAVHGMPLIANLQTKDLIPLIMPFETASPFGRTKAVTTAINLTRWILTVGKLGLLPPAPAADLNEALVRPSPYLGADPFAQPGKLTIHLGYVDKTVYVPSAHLQALLSVYGLLKAKKIPNAISCRWLHVGGHKVQLQHPMPIYSATERDYHMVSMRLEPVGANWLPPSPGQLYNLTESLLTTLQALHAHGHVHRDIRSDNILSVSSGWMLIDWELAAPSGSPVFWDGTAFPPSMSPGDSWRPQHDLWQLGLLLQKQPQKTHAVEAFAQQLMNMQSASASVALQALRSTPSWL